MQSLSKRLALIFFAAVCGIHAALNPPLQYTEDPITNVWLRQSRDDPLRFLRLPSQQPPQNIMPVLMQKLEFFDPAMAAERGIPDDVAQGVYGVMSYYRIECQKAMDEGVTSWPPEPDTTEQERQILAEEFQRVWMEAQQHSSGADSVSGDSDYVSVLEYSDTRPPSVNGASTVTASEDVAMAVAPETAEDSDSQKVNKLLLNDGMVQEIIGLRLALSSRESEDILDYMEGAATKSIRRNKGGRFNNLVRLGYAKKAEYKKTIERFTDFLKVLVSSSEDIDAVIQTKAEELQVLMPYGRAIMHTLAYEAERAHNLATTKSYLKHYSAWQLRDSQWYFDAKINQYRRFIFDRHHPLVFTQFLGVFVKYNVARTARASFAALLKDDDISRDQSLRLLDAIHRHFGVFQGETIDMALEFGDL